MSRVFELLKTQSTSVVCRTRACTVPLCLCNSSAELSGPWKSITALLLRDCSKSKKLLISHFARTREQDLNIQQCNNHLNYVLSFKYPGNSESLVQR